MEERISLGTESHADGEYRFQAELPSHFAKALPVTEEAERIVKQIFDPEKISKSEVAAFFDCPPDLVTGEDVARVKHRARYLYSQVIAGLLAHATSKTPEGRLAEAIKIASNTGWHDLMHAAATYEESTKKGKDNAAPDFAIEKKKIVSEKLIRDEMMPLLFRLHPREDRKSIFLEAITDRGSEGFDVVFKRYLTYALLTVENQLKYDFVHMHHIETAKIDSYLSEYGPMANKVFLNPGSEVKKRAKRIYDGWCAGNKRIFLEEFFSMTTKLDSKKSH